MPAATVGPFRDHDSRRVYGLGEEKTHSTRFPIYVSIRSKAVKLISPLAGKSACWCDRLTHLLARTDRRHRGSRRASFRCLCRAGRRLPPARYRPARGRPLPVSPRQRHDPEQSTFDCQSIGETYAACVLQGYRAHAREIDSRFDCHNVSRFERQVDASCGLVIVTSPTGAVQTRRVVVDRRRSDLL